MTVRDFKRCRSKAANEVINGELVHAHIQEWQECWNNGIALSVPHFASLFLCIFTYILSRQLLDDISHPWRSYSSVWETEALSDIKSFTTGATYIAKLYYLFGNPLSCSQWERESVAAMSLCTQKVPVPPLSWSSTCFLKFHSDKFSSKFQFEFTPSQFQIGSSLKAIQ